MLLEIKTNPSDQFFMVSIDLEQGELLGATILMLFKVKNTVDSIKNICPVLAIHCEAHYFHLDKV